MIIVFFTFVISILLKNNIQTPIANKTKNNNIKSYSNYLGRLYSNFHFGINKKQ